jgi:predicted ArsR family transcriptional regulator
MSLESGEQPERRGQRRRLLDDPRSMRAMAHPLRLELQSIVGRSGRITTADAARELGISHGLASHHLHQLAKYGFVEQVQGSDNRERPWQLVATSISAQGLEDKPGGESAVRMFEQVAAERTLESFLSWQERRDGWPAGWRENTGLGRSTIYLTQEELAALVAAFQKLIDDYVEERPLDDLSSRPAGAVPVEFSLFAIPLEPTTEGN